MLMAQINPLNLPGPAFLAFYLILLASAAIIAILVRRWLVAGGDDRPPPRMQLDAYEAAFLSGGEDAVVDTAIAMLVQRQALKASSASRSLTTCGPLPRDAHPAEQAVYSAVTSQYKPVQDVRAAAKRSVAHIADRLKMMGLILSDARWQMVRIIPALILVAVLVVAIAKIYIGMSRNRPVTFLELLAAVTGLIAWMFFKSRPRVTPLGEQALEQLKIDNVALHTTARSRPQLLAPGDMAFAIGLFGVASLPFADATWTELRQALSPPPVVGSGSSSGSSSSCGSSSCSSSSCSSSCGSSCGGGGCGGCGGS